MVGRARSGLAEFNSHSGEGSVISGSSQGICHTAGLAAMQARRRDLAEIIVDVVQTGVERERRERAGRREEHLCRD